MSARYWIKLYIELLDDAKMGRLPNHLWRRAVELFLLAGRQGSDGALPPVEEMAWILRLLPDRLLEDLHSLAEIGVVHACSDPAAAGEEAPVRWMVTNFSKRQAAVPVDVRVRQHRLRNAALPGDNGPANEAAAAASASASDSDSDSDSAPGPPRSPVEAMLHPDVKIFCAVTGGRVPGLSQYTQVIEAVRYLRKTRLLDDPALIDWLKPYWLAWTGRKRRDGRPYDPGNLTWLTEWALNASIPSSGALPPARSPVPSPEETRRLLDERDEKNRQAVPPPEELRAKMRDLSGRLAAREDR